MKYLDVCKFSQVQQQNYICNIISLIIFYIESIKLCVKYVKIGHVSN